MAKKAKKQELGSGSRDSIEDAAFGPLRITGVRCKHCEHFNGPPAFEAPCSQLGRRTFSPPCQKFTITLKAIDFTDEKGWAPRLNKLISSADQEGLAVIAALVSQEHKTRKVGFKYGQEVWVKMLGGDYLSNYGKARVVKADKEYVHLKGVGSNFQASFHHASVISPEDYEAMRLKLIDKGRIIDPDYRKYYSFIPIDKKSVVNRKMTLRGPGTSKKKTSNREVVKVRGN